jgi:branched-chain amino acid transport system substrate-binding protein
MEGGPGLETPAYPAVSDLPRTPVKVGLLVPLSGGKAAIGQAMLNAAQMAVFDSGLETFEILPRDTGDSPDRARSAARDAVAAGAQILIGPLTAPSARACASVAQGAGVSMISFSTDWTVASSGPLVMGFTPFGQVRRMAEWAAENGLRRVAVLAPDNDYGNAALKTFQTRGREVGLNLVSVAKVPAHAEAFENEVTSLLTQAGRGPDGLAALDAVFLPMPGDKAARVSALLSAAGLPPDRVRRMGTGLWDDAVLASTPELSGAVFAAPAPSLREEFESRYMRTYGGAPPRLSTLAYDATALAAVLARGGLERTGRPAFSRADVLNPNGFAGLDGIFRFRSDGLAERGVAVLTFSRGMIREAVPAPRTFQAMERM